MYPIGGFKLGWNWLTRSIMVLAFIRALVIVGFQMILWPVKKAYERARKR